ncbi:DNA-3-methyladenine glycosylase I [Devosia sp. BK]|uniref:DNA-3-methyladenine glycosylase I n=1 Tax=Devosia sp. BK TaxID=2871706 RepID=UPI00293A2453|nr:DNA-3-methyladenine glycosylase I [Devosia sp. BK]MDV3253347.1 DNA-3-methyladenine glycosylase I [Devosia sp. BK]
MSGTLPGPDGRERCAWCAGAPEFVPYHDHEWGFPVSDDRRLFEKICLEGFQSGLSWRTILNKRDAFRTGFAHFEIDAVAKFTEADVERLLQDKGIVRHRGKIAAAINNAKRAQELIKEAGSIAAFVWRYEVPEGEAPPPQSQTTSPEAIALSKALKKRGWAFVGPTTVFAFMQAMGLVNDHALGCVSREKAAAERAAFKVPGRG